MKISGYFTIEINQVLFFEFIILQIKFILKFL